MESLRQPGVRQSSRIKTKKAKGMRNNVFTSYFRKKHQREAAKKEEARKASIEKQKEVLRAIKFSEAEEERLQELKRHKKWKKIQQEQQLRFQRLSEKAMPRIPEYEPVTPSSSAAPLGARRALESQLAESQPLSPRLEGETFVERSMEAMHRHTWGQRVSVVGTLMVFLFISLHADVLGRRLLPPLLFLDNNDVTWYVIVLKDCGRFCHMSVCSLIHFALCDISLIYAFESMELGKKTGPVVKKFYREKMHVVVAALSGGIVALSICKALLMAWYRMLRELVDTLLMVGRDSYSSAASTIQALWSIPDTFLSCMQKVWALAVCTWAAMQSTSPSKWLSSAYAWLTRVVTGLCIWVVAKLIPFKEGKQDVSTVPELSPLDDGVGDDNMTSLESQTSVLDDGLNMNTTTGTANATFSNFSNSIFEPSFTTSSESGLYSREELYWRNDAFETCRYLLTHSAVFLVAFLVAYNVLAKSYRYREIAVSDDQEGADDSVALSSIRTSETLAKDEHLATNLSMETTGTIAETVSTVRPSSITVTIPVSRESYYGGSRSSRGTSRGSRRSS